MSVLRRLRLTNTPEGGFLPGRTDPVPVIGNHLVLGTPMVGPWPDGMVHATFAMGCFWGAEKFMWKVPGVYSTFVGYTGGHTPNPTYEEVCSGRTGHAEAARVIFDPGVATFDDLLKVFWENHDPTQWMRQGGDVGTQYRSAIYVADSAQEAEAVASRAKYQEALRATGYGEIVTEVTPEGPWYYAEPLHQQYLARNPRGYCNHGFCQVEYASPSSVAGQSGA